MADSSRLSNLPGNLHDGVDSRRRLCNSQTTTLSRFVGLRQRLAQSASIAASSIIIASRFLASSNGRVVISAILRSR